MVDYVVTKILHFILYILSYVFRKDGGKARNRLFWAFSGAFSCLLLDVNEFQKSLQ